MSNIRKGSFVQVLSSNAVGVVSAMSKKEDKISLTQSGKKRPLTVPYMEPLKKITKAEFDDIMASAIPAKKISVASEARALFVKMTKKDSVKRKDVINAFVEDLGLTRKGAPTYYYNCTKARKAGTL